MTVAGWRAGAGRCEAGSGAGTGVERAGTGEAIAAGGEENFAKGKGVVVIDVVAMLSKMGAKAGAAAAAGVKGENIKGHSVALTLCNSSRISWSLRLNLAYSSSSSSNHNLKSYSVGSPYHVSPAMVVVTQPTWRALLASASLAASHISMSSMSSSDSPVLQSRVLA